MSRLVLADTSLIATVAHFVVAAAVTPFDPSKISGLELWLRGDLGVHLTSGNVDTWADQSGNGNNFTQATSGARPPTNTAIGGQACLVFNGTTALQAGNFISTGAKTIVIVRKYAAATGIAQSLLLLMTGTTVTKMDYCSADVSPAYAPFQFFADLLAAGGAGRATAPAMDASAHMDFMDYNGGTNTSSASYDAWIDGTTSAISAGGFYIETPSNLTSIGANINSSGALVSPAVVTAASVAEVLVWGRQLTSTERNQLGGYIQTRYGITIAGATF
jgi:hypothetical protein